MPERKPSVRLTFKQALLSPTTPTPAGSLAPAERWCELVAQPFFQECARLAYGEYVMGLVPDVQVPGVAAYKAVGAREMLNVLFTLGEPTKPHIPADAAKRLEPV